MPRYKYGKIEKPMDLNILAKLMDRVKDVNRGPYGVQFIQALIALFYWTGFRRSEVLGDSGLKWRLKSGEIRKSPPFPGLLKENITIDYDEGFRLIRQVARKHGRRIEPVALPLFLPYVDLIVKQWEEAEPGQRVFPIDEVTFWRILKRIDPKIYPHYFCLNRVTKLAENRDNSLQDIVNWTGKSPQTIAYYLAKAGRYSKEVGKRMLEEK
jgi:hypothetical protein